ncbi:MAG: NAD(+) synthase [Clostridiales bacterium]|nr:NAD(+) synthase [Clostridiales bacterium]
MRDGFIKVAAFTPKVAVADTITNGERIRRLMAEADRIGAQITVFPELCITGYTCGDLFWQEKLLSSAKEELWKIVDYSAQLDGIFFVGLPFEVDGKLYNMAAAVSGGAVQGMVPKTYLPNYNEYYEARHFTSGEGLNVFWSETTPDYTGENEETGSFSCLERTGNRLPQMPEEDEETGCDAEDEDGKLRAFMIATRQLFRPMGMPRLTIGVELCEDLWTPNPPSISHALCGADVIVNLSASDEVTGKSGYRRDLVVGQSARLVCAYIYASAGDGESTQDVVYSGHNLIAENGHLLAEAEPFWGSEPNVPDTESVFMVDGDGCRDGRIGHGIASEIDIDRLCAERRRMGTFCVAKNPEAAGYTIVDFIMAQKDTRLTRYVDPRPFVPADHGDRDRRCNEILTIQAMGLKKRIEHTHCAHPVVGISGGLDSALALLVIARAFDLLGRDRKDLVAVTMPGFGTTDRTYENACQMVRSLGATLMEIPIADAVNLHFKNIGQDPTVHDVTYENSQARERTQILMDVANRLGGMVIGTGDLSELALGWATYNGDHMSMYAVNSSVPKTLVRHLVRYYADTCGDEKLGQVLYDVLDTPVSPELLPPEDGQISQKTEDLVGPYELHDFFLYYVLRFGFPPGKIYRLARQAFAGEYEDEVILKWLKVFYRRFFAQQFKRSCLPDGPKVGTVAVSPRGDLRMPSDASARIWLEEAEQL